MATKRSATGQAFAIADTVLLALIKGIASNLTLRLQMELPLTGNSIIGWIGGGVKRQLGQLPFGLVAD